MINIPELTRNVTSSGESCIQMKHLFIFKLGLISELLWLWMLIVEILQLDAKLNGDLVDAVNSLWKLVLVFSHHLQRDGRSLTCVHADVPTHDSELNLMFFTNVNAFVETFCVEEMASQSDVHHWKIPLKWKVLQLIAIHLLTIQFWWIGLIFVCNFIIIQNLHISVLCFLIYFSQSRYVKVIRSQLSVATNHSIEDFRWQWLLLLFQIIINVRLDCFGNERIKLLAKMITRLLRHFGR